MEKKYGVYIARAAGIEKAIDIEKLSKMPPRELNFRKKQ